ncbi:hypothetical protein SBA3_280009 [Candidatus Sulfopaludibacter sp. SbA3]|nr:hypothetical protein SBA3_280009 [Candidatus Sulfopaludibacter sp. SbA3]
MAAAVIIKSAVGPFSAGANTSPGPGSSPVPLLFMPLFKNLDSVFGFVLLMLAAGTVVAAATQFAATLTRMRARFLRQAVEELLSQVAPAHLSSEDARQLALILLHHPWLCGRTNAGASSLRREDLVRLLVEVASQDSLLAARLRDALDLAGAGEALDLARRIGSHVLALELENPGECTRDRDTKAIPRRVHARSRHQSHHRGHGSTPAAGLHPLLVWTGDGPGHKAIHAPDPRHHCLPDTGVGAGTTPGSVFVFVFSPPRMRPLARHGAFLASHQSGHPVLVRPDERFVAFSSLANLTKVFVDIDEALRQ